MPDTPRPEPPDNDEIDITPTGVTIAGELIDGSNNANQLAPEAFGTVTKFTLTRKLNGVVQQPIDVTGVRIPYSNDVRLQVSVDRSNQPTWNVTDSNGNRNLTRASETVWPSELLTAAASTQWPVAYQTTVGGTWTPLTALGDFVDLAFQTRS